jgi:hypothetical protein
MFGAGFAQNRRFDGSESWPAREEQPNIGISTQLSAKVPSGATIVFISFDPQEVCFWREAR